jgi:NADH:quinone reductase (non-electrogenic)
MDGAPTDGRHVVIVGGGFAGLYAARVLGGTDVRVTLVDWRNHHLFQPLLYQVATAALAAPDIAAPIRKVLERDANVTVLLAEVTAIDVARRRIALADGALDYDLAILAPGTVHHYFGHDDWRRHAPGLKSLADAFTIRRRVLLAFEHAERAADTAARLPWLTFVVIGAGPTGVELAGALREIAQRTLARDFRRFDPGATRVILVDAADRVLPAFPERCSRDARRLLERCGVELRLGVHASAIDACGVEVDGERLAARTVLWAAGVRPSPLGRTLGVPLTRDGRVLVAPDLSLPGHPEVFVAGDLAAVRQPDGTWVPAMAPGAIQMGRHAARNVLRTAHGETTAPFRYADRGMLATIGRSAAVARIGRLHVSGFAAWVLWLFVHVFWLIGFRNRAVVLFEWAWAYLTWQRSARVIVDTEERGS